MKSTLQFHLGFERKIGYSFVGLLAGNLASLVLLLLAALALHTKWFDEIRNLWSLSIGQAFMWSWLVLIFSILAWIVVGLPLVLLLRAEFVAGLHWIFAVLIGAIVGTFAMFLIFFAMNGGHVSALSLLHSGAYQPFYSAALIAAIAFATYCKLVKMAMRGQTRKSGAP